MGWVLLILPQKEQREKFPLLSLHHIFMKLTETQHFQLFKIHAFQSYGRLGQVRRKNKEQNDWHSAVTRFVSWHLKNEPKQKRTSKYQYNFHLQERDRHSFMTRGAGGAAEVPHRPRWSPCVPSTLLSLQGLGKQASRARRKGNASGVQGTAIAWLFL